MNDGMAQEVCVLLADIRNELQELREAHCNGVETLAGALIGISDAIRGQQTCADAAAEDGEGPGESHYEQPLYREGEDPARALARALGAKLHDDPPPAVEQGTLVEMPKTFSPSTGPRAVALDPSEDSVRDKALAAEEAEESDPDRYEGVWEAENEFPADKARHGLPVR